MKVELDKFNNDWFRPGSKFKIILWIFCSFIFIRTSFPWPMSFKKILLRFFGCRFGKGLVIKPQVNIKYPWMLTMGDHVWIGEEVWIDNLAKVNIHSHVCVSQGAMLLTGNHNYKIASFDLEIGDITLEEGVWIAAKSVVCPGVKAEKNSILSVSSIATKNMLANKVYQGNPAKMKKDRI